MNSVRSFELKVISRSVNYDDGLLKEEGNGVKVLDRKTNNALQA